MRQSRSASHPTIPPTRGTTPTGRQTPTPTSRNLTESSTRTGRARFHSGRVRWEWRRLSTPRLPAGTGRLCPRNTAPSASPQPSLRKRTFPPTLVGGVSMELSAKVRNSTATLCASTATHSRPLKGLRTAGAEVLSTAWSSTGPAEEPARADVTRISEQASMPSIPETISRRTSFRSSTGRSNSAVAQGWRLQ